MKKLDRKQTLNLRLESIKALTEDRLRSANGGRWYESWSMCGSDSQTQFTSCQQTGCASGARG
jgi:hypothetical protein